MWVRYGIEQRDRRARRVAEQIERVELEVRSHRLDVGHDPVHPIRVLVFRCRGSAGTTEVESMKFAVRGEAAEIA